MEEDSHYGVIFTVSHKDIFLVNDTKKETKQTFKLRLLTNATQKQTI